MFRLEHKTALLSSGLRNDTILGKHFNTFMFVGPTPHPHRPPTTQLQTSFVVRRHSNQFQSPAPHMSCVPCFNLSRTWHHTDAPLRILHQSSYDALPILRTLRSTGGQDPVDSQSVPSPKATRFRRTPQGKASIKIRQTCSWHAAVDTEDLQRTAKKSSVCARSFYLVLRNM